jgi:signal peptidase I
VSSLAIRVAVAFLLLLAAARSRIHIVVVGGRSMEPVLRGGDVLVAVRIPRVLLSRALSAEAILAIRPPAYGAELQIKRVAGLPGDRVLVGTGLSRAVIVVPRGTVFVAGTAPSSDCGPPPPDSRSYGPLALSAVHALVLARVRPTRRAAWLYHRSRKLRYGR